MAAVGSDDDFRFRNVLSDVLGLSKRVHSFCKVGVTGRRFFDYLISIDIGRTFLDKRSNHIFKKEKIMGFC